MSPYTQIICNLCISKKILDSGQVLSTTYCLQVYTTVGSDTYGSATIGSTTDVSTTGCTFPPLVAHFHHYHPTHTPPSIPTPTDRVSNSLLHLAIQGDHYPVFSTSYRPFYILPNFLSDTRPSSGDITLQYFDVSRMLGLLPEVRRKQVITAEFRRKQVI